MKMIDIAVDFAAMWFTTMLSGLVVVLVLGLVLGALGGCGQVSDAELASLTAKAQAYLDSKEQAPAESTPAPRQQVDVVIEAPELPELTPVPAAQVPSGRWVFGYGDAPDQAVVCDFDSRLCYGGGAVGFDAVGPVLVLGGSRYFTAWADWRRAEEQK